MKISLIVIALVSVALAAPHEGHSGVKTSSRHKGNNVRLVCENGLCVLKSAQGKEAESSTTEAPVEISTKITDEKTVEEERGDQPHIDQETETHNVENHDESDDDSTEQHQHETEESHKENDEHDEHHEPEETHNESDEHHEKDETNSESSEEDHNESSEHDESGENDEESKKYTTMIAEHPLSTQHDLSSEDKDHEDHEDHTLSMELMPPHEESVWNMSNDQKENDDSSVIYKIPNNDRKYLKGVKGVKTPIKL